MFGPLECAKLLPAECAKLFVSHAKCTEQNLIHACKFVFIHTLRLAGIGPRAHLHVPQQFRGYAFTCEKTFACIFNFNFQGDALTLVGICTGLDHPASAVWLKTSFVSSQKLINFHLWVCAGLPNCSVSLP